MSAPSAHRHCAVASISRLVSGQRICVSRSAKAANISSLWAWDLDGIARTVPFKHVGVMVISILYNPAEMNSSSCSTGVGRISHRPMARGMIRLTVPPARFLSERAYSARAFAVYSVRVGRWNAYNIFSIFSAFSGESNR